MKKNIPLVDVFMYFNEPELLELRYHMFKDLVEKFVVCESNYTFSGIKKTYQVKELIKNLNFDENKFLILEVDNSDENLKINEYDLFAAHEVGRPEKVNVFVRQRLQRDAINNIIETFEDDTIFICSDIDEIVDPKALNYLASVIVKYPNNILKVPLVLLEETADARLYTQDGQPVKWERSLFLVGKQGLRHHGITALRSEFKNSYKPITVTENGQLVEDLGWHFTWMGNKEKKVQKLKSCAHSISPNLINNISSNLKSSLVQETGELVGEIVNYHKKTYDINLLPPHIFSIPRVKQFLLPHLTTPKVIDYFMYFNEKELLELRYHMLKDVVDLFLISESNVTFSGNVKEFSVEKVINDLNLDRKKFRILSADLSNIDKSTIMPIDEIYSLVANDNKSVLNWTRERIQRDAIMSVIDEFDDDCMVIVSDVDEIIKPSALKYLLEVAKQNQNVIIKVPLVLLEGRADKRLVNINGNIVDWDKSMFIASKIQLKNQSPNSIRGNSQNKFPITYITENNQVVKDLGWHFTWMGNENRRKIKAMSYGHAGNLSAANTLSIDSFAKISNSLNVSEKYNYNYKLINYPISDLPKEIFELSSVKNFLLPNVFDKTRLNEFIVDPNNFLTNFNLALEYEKVGQTAAAVSYYLRAAEKTDNLSIQYESIMRIAFCFQQQKNRNFSVINLFIRAITIDPIRPEAYYHLSKIYYETKDYQSAYLYAKLGLTMIDNRILVSSLTDLQFKSIYELKYYMAMSGWFVGFYKQAKEVLTNIIATDDITPNLKKQINIDLIKIRR